ncbi:MAG: enoyl-CoA hydratase-related protein [Thermoleophilia bacterium]|jgi:dihydroxynaphthoic acid synthetase
MSGPVTPAPPRAYEDILVARGEGRATITIDRPDRLNALRTQTLDELCHAFEAAVLDEGVGVIVFTGAGDRAFCVGGDVRDPTRTSTEKRRQAALFMRLAETIRTSGKPVIVRVRGYCIGAGNELNIVSDLTISGASGVFGQAGTRLGWAPTLWTAQILARMAGEKRAREVVYMSRRYPADEAVRLGLANVVVPDEELDAEVDRWCEQILRRSPEGLRLAKLGLNAGTDFARQSILASGEMHILNHLFGPEPQEGLIAFRERRLTDWRRFRRGEGPEPADD